MMKNIFLALFLGFTLTTAASYAQINISVNLGSQPQWGPAGYNYVEYYYLPDIETYYYVPKKQFVYLKDGRWVFSTRLPSRYSGYDLYSGYKVVLNSPRPYLSFTSHKMKYGKFKGLKGKQKTIKSKPPGNSIKSGPKPGNSHNFRGTGSLKKPVQGNQPHRAPGNGNSHRGKGKGKH